MPATASPCKVLRRSLAREPTAQLKPVRRVTDIYEGMVNQVMGDGIMALFGAPTSHADHAVRACYAALRMQELVKQYAEEVRRTHGVPMYIRVGLDAGEVVVRAIGSDLHMGYTAVGHTTHLAARMEQMAMPGSILVTPEALRLAEGHIQVNALGPVPIKGLQAPVEIFKRLDRRGLGAHPPRYIIPHLGLRCRLSSRQVRRTTLTAHPPGRQRGEAHADRHEISLRREHGCGSR
jgi:Adenylate and Guanylate cyclase catalytic domain